MKRTFFIVIIAVLIGAGYWYARNSGWLNNTAPDNLPTKEEWERIEAVEEASSQIAPDAKPGIQVREKGSTPPPPPTTPPQSAPTITDTVLEGTEEAE